MRILDMFVVSLNCNGRYVPETETDKYEFNIECAQMFALEKDAKNFIKSQNDPKRFKLFQIKERFKRIKWFSIDDGWFFTLVPKDSPSHRTQQINSLKYDLDNVKFIINDCRKTIKKEREDIKKLKIQEATLLQVMKKMIKKGEQTC